MGSPKLHADRYECAGSGSARPTRGPKPDPAARQTGVASDVPGFIVSAPADLSADDAKDAAKVKAFSGAKKRRMNYAAQAKMEPLASSSPTRGPQPGCHQLHVDPGSPGSWSCSCKPGRAGETGFVAGEKRRPHHVHESS